VHLQVVRQAFITDMKQVPEIEALLLTKSQEFSALAVGVQPGRARNLLDKYIMETHRKADRASFRLSAQAQRSADYVLNLMLTELRDTATSTAARRSFLSDADRVAAVRADVVKDVFGELTGAGFISGFIGRDLCDAAKRALIRSAPRNSAKKRTATAASADQQQQQQDKAVDDRQQLIGELYKATRRTVIKVGEKAQELLDADAAIAAARSSSSTMEVDSEFTTHQAAADRKSELTAYNAFLTVSKYNRPCTPSS
jgi:hypothetical protein